MYKKLTPSEQLDVLIKLQSIMGDTKGKYSEELKSRLMATYKALKCQGVFGEPE